MASLTKQWRWDLGYQGQIRCTHLASQSLISAMLICASSDTRCLVCHVIGKSWYCAADSEAQDCAVQAKQIMAWGAEGVIVGSALVKALGDAASPEEGLRRMEELAKSIREAI